jgi:hypothetical protein
MSARRDPDARERLARIAPRVVVGALAGERTLPVAPALSTLFPVGLARGATVACSGPAASSTALLLCSGAVEAGAWIGVVGLVTVGLPACREAGIALERLVLVREPATPFGDDTWGQVLAALIDGFDVVVLGAAPRVRAGTARRLQSRLQSRGAVLVIVGDPGAFSCDVRATSTAVTWHGLGDGHGHLRERRVELTVEGRRIPRARRQSLWFPGADGRIAPVVAQQSDPSETAALQRTG